MRFLLVGDVHLADRPPSMRVEGYAEQILDKLRFTVDVARDHDVDGVVWAGDVFHLKAPNRTSHWLVQQVAQVGQAYARPWYVVPGNHDVVHDRLESLERQPLGVLYAAGARSLVGVQDDGLFGIPWLQDWKRDLPAYMEDWREAESALMVTHAPIVAPGATRPYEVIDARDWANAMMRSGSVYFGHIHDPDGVFEVGQTVFCNEGALSRGSLHESTVNRKPAVTLWEDGVFERVEVPHLPADQVFRLAEVEEAQQAVLSLEEFLGSIGTTTLAAVSIERVMTDLVERGVGAEVIEEIRSCIEEVA